MKVTIACIVLAFAVVGRAEPPVNRYLPPGRSNDYQTSNDFGQPSSTYGAPSEQYGAPRQTQAISRRPSQSYGAPRSRPSSQYGPPSQRISQSYGPPSARSNNMISRQYGAPQQHSGANTQQFGARSQQFGAPSQQYGAPSQYSGTPSQQYGAPSQYSGTPPQTYGAPSQYSGSQEQRFGSAQEYNSAPSSQYGAPPQQFGARSGISQQYGAPQRRSGSPSQRYGAPSQEARVPSNQYLPASKAGYGRNADDESNNEQANYNFEYMVKDDESGADFGHRESRQYDRAEGSYFVLLPDGRKQTVQYEADEEGFKPKITYEDTSLGYARGAGGYDSNSQNYSGNSGYPTEPQGPY